ncbi:MAG: UDP-N-acetylmuramoyl-L-alanyl-D-glutamate--2,6-diaminopimelate ligase [Ignavibacteria bacterium]|nr:UDP-N-acetylmuramoyl-L-alanyl-D-glutamate--2,6-diaminopimelate ligase [Ignavibacteria bacterium]
MKLTEFLNIPNCLKAHGNIENIDITGIYYDSRKVVKGSIFVAIKGYSTDGHKFINDVLNKNVSAVFVEDESYFESIVLNNSKTVFVLVKDTREALAELSKIYFEDPSNRIKLFGVTGTNGKTTTTYLLKSIFETANEKTGIIGTIANLIGDVKIATEMTTPESLELNSLLNEMYIQGCSTVAMEVSSHSLFLKRVYGLNFAAAIFTNLTLDHLDFHKSIDGYVNSKKILFDQLDENSFCIYNIDDEYHEQIIKDCVARKVSFGTMENSDFKITDITFDLSGTSFKLIHNNQTFVIKTSLVGGFNAYNVTGAFIAAYMMGFDTDLIIKGIEIAPQVPGRFEVLGFEEKKVIIDFAHTSDSLEKTLLNIREIIGTSRPLYTVMGCGGDRDQGKRPIMGKVASELSDKVIVTNDNPRTENEDQIIEDILAGILQSNFIVQKNREQAIRYAIKESPSNAVILVAGKGHEDYQIIGKTKFHLSDKEIALQVLGELQHVEKI